MSLAGCAGSSLPIHASRPTFDASERLCQQLTYVANLPALIDSTASLKTLLALLLGCFGLSVAGAQTISCELYRYKNANGVTELSNSIPPELVDKGYTCINRGREIVVPPKLPPNEQEQRDRDEEAEKAAKEAGVPHERTDEELEKLYASPCDVEASRTRKILSIEAAIKSTKANLQSLKLKKQDFEEEAAERERAGLSPSADILQNLESVDAQIIETNNDIAKRQLEKQHTLGQFELDLARMNALHPAGPCSH